MDHSNQNTRKTPDPLTWNDKYEALSQAFFHGWPSSQLVDRMINDFDETALSRGLK